MEDVPAKTDRRGIFRVICRAIYLKLGVGQRPLPVPEGMFLKEKKVVKTSLIGI